MPANLIKQWADGHSASAVSRVVKRLERFAGNTTDTDTSACANDLLELIKANSKPDTDE